MLLTQRILPTSFLAAALLVFAGFGVATVWDIVDGPEDARTENLVQTPPLPKGLGDVPRFTKFFEYYIDKRFAGRDAMIALNGAFKTAVFRTSPYPSVAIGEAGWLFLSDDDILTYQLKPDDFSASAWLAAFADAKDLVAEAGAEFRVIVVPEKQTFLPDAAPTWLSARPTGSSPFDLFETATRSEPYVVDTRQALRLASDTAPVYYRTDTHWNEWGAANVTSALLASLGDDAGPALLVRNVRSKTGGDLARMIGQQSSRTEETASVALATSADCRDAKGEPVPRNILDPLRSRAYDCKNPRKAGRALVFMDSFGVSLMAPLAAEYETTRLLWQQRMSREEILQFRPDVVLLVMAERKLVGVQPADILPE